MVTTHVSCLGSHDSNLGRETYRLDWNILHYLLHLSVEYQRFGETAYSIDNIGLTLSAGFQFAQGIYLKDGIFQVLFH